MNCKEAIPLIHEYLDGDLESDQLAMLHGHLEQCEACRARLAELELTEAMMSTLRKPSVETDTRLSTERIMSLMPPSKQAAVPSWVKWFRRHPAASVAAVFLFVMLTSVMSLWNYGSQLTVSGQELDKLVFEGNTVTVPEGQVVKGDITVENGSVRVNGVLDGNLVVIDGSVAMASTAKITGSVKSVNQAIDWLWFKIAGLLQAPAVP